MEEISRIREADYNRMLKKNNRRYFLKHFMGRYVCWRTNDKYPHPPPMIIPEGYLPVRKIIDQPPLFRIVTVPEKNEPRHLSLVESQG